MVNEHVKPARPYQFSGRFKSQPSIVIDHALDYQKIKVMVPPRVA